MTNVPHFVPRLSPTLLSMMQPSLTILGRSTARGCPSFPCGMVWILTRVLPSSTRWDPNFPWQVRPRPCWPKGSSGIARKGGAWACLLVVFKTETSPCTLVQRMASSALTTTLLLSSTSFAMERWSCVRQKGLSAARLAVTLHPLLV